MSSPTDESGPTPVARPRSKLPRHLFGGRARTGTLLLLLVFVGLLVLYGQRVDHYAKLDKQNRPPTVTLPVVTQPRQQDSPTTTGTIEPSSSPSSSSSSVSPPNDSSTSSSSTSTTPASIFPGLIPGVAPTTTVTVRPTS